MAAWLSSKIVVALVEPPPNSVVSCLSHTASCAVLAKAIYSASAVDSATEDCFLLLQLTAPPLIWNRYPDVDLRSSRSPAQSASE